MKRVGSEIKISRLTVVLLLIKIEESLGLIRKYKIDKQKEKVS